MYSLIADSRGILSTKTACDIASSMVTGLFRPIATQIDPARIAFVERHMRVAQYYGDRLKTANVKPGRIEYLIRNYPSHGFIIDWEEAEEIFHKVELPSDVERTALSHYADLVVRPSDRKSTVIDVLSNLQERTTNARGQEKSVNDEAGGAAGSVSEGNP